MEDNLKQILADIAANKYTVPGLRAELKGEKPVAETEELQFRQKEKAPLGQVDPNRTDTERLDWLALQLLTVRIPLRYGSQEAFISKPYDDDGEEIPSPLRSLIDGQMGKAPQVKPVNFWGNNRPVVVRDTRQQSGDMPEGTTYKAVNVRYLNGKVGYRCDAITLNWRNISHWQFAERGDSILRGEMR